MLIFTRPNDLQQPENEDFWAPYSARKFYVVSLLPCLAMSTRRIRNHNPNLQIKYDSSLKVTSFISHVLKLNGCIREPLELLSSLATLQEAFRLHVLKLIPLLSRRNMSWQSRSLTASPLASLNVRNRGGGRGSL